MSPLELRIRIREHRQRAGLTQVELATLAGTGERVVNHLENNITRRVDLDIIDRIARALKVEPGELLHRARVSE